MLFLLSLQLPDSFDKNSDFTWQSTGAAGPPPPRSLSLFVLLYDFGILMASSASQKSHTNKQTNTLRQRQMSTSGVLLGKKSLVALKKAKIKVLVPPKRGLSVKTHGCCVSSAPGAPALPGELVGSPSPQWQSSTCGITLEKMLLPRLPPQQCVTWLPWQYLCLLFQTRKYNPTSKRSKLSL